MNWLQRRSNAHVEELLARLLPPLDALLRRDAIRVVAEAVVLDQRQDFDSPEILITTLTKVTQRSAAEIERLEGESSALLLAYQQSLDEAERREVLKRHLRATSNANVSTRRDQAAVGRWLDIEAVRERYSMRVSQLTDEVVVCFDSISGLLADDTSLPGVVQTLRRSGILPSILDLAVPEVRPTIRCAALRASAAILRRLEPTQRAPALGVVNLRRLSDFSRGVEAPRWVQLTALSVVVTYLPPNDLVALLQELLSQRDASDSMVIRAGAVRQLAWGPMTSMARLARLALRDPSEHVRQELGRSLIPRSGASALRMLLHLAIRDPSPRVRGIGLVSLIDRAAIDSKAVTWTIATLIRCLRDTEPNLVLRVALASVARLCTLRNDVPPERFARALVTLANSSTAPPEISELAAATLRSLALSDEARTLSDKLRGILAELGEGQARRLHLIESPTEIIGALRIAARGDHAVALRPLGRDYYRLTRGEPRRLRLWRLWHELRNPMPDKRKGYLHSLGRAAQGPYLVPPIGMAEVTPTRVPGERVLHGRVGGWGHFLPRIDDLLTATLRRQPVRLVTSFGTIVLHGPRGLRPRLRAYLWLNHNYANASLIRESALESTEPRGQQTFAGLLSDLGFTISLDPNDAAVSIAGTSSRLTSPLLARFLVGSGPAITIPPDLVSQFFVHALSPNANTPAQLALVVWVILVVFILRATVIMHQIVRDRRAIPLSIGGWGTRGKSGSERLKAALFHALRYDVVVKTTGCEAMFIHAQRDQPAQEIFIYRPYDKATIWEQRHMLHVARRLRTQVFLWECMALQPRFVETLIDEWMQDPITTLTNAYPDHEDIQGPSGEDVARVIGRFMPRQGTTFTTEEQMLPLLCDAARSKGTKLIRVEPLEADLLPIDLLNRLPYQEHPRNVALVLALAEHFKIDREYALVEIADHVVLDLGVLKTYPEAKYRGRRLVFSNGMSANERAGFMSNWTRLGFDRHDVDRDADTVTVAVVNNRGDRVARSRVFAQILVDDASLSSIVLINSNLGGMLGFIQEALDKKLTTLSLLGDGPNTRILERFDEHLRWLKVPLDAESPRRSLERMLPLLGLTTEGILDVLARPDVSSAISALAPDTVATALEAVLPKNAEPEATALRHDVIVHAVRQVKRLKQANGCRRSIASAIESGNTGNIDGIFRQTYRELFLERISILWNSGATGDQVIDGVTDSIPPGHLARVLGCQNIKGTGLDFVYRWLSVDRVHTALEKLESSPGQRQELLAWLGSYNDFGLVDAREALVRLEGIRGQKDPAWSALDPMLLGVVTRLRQLVQEKQSRLHAEGKADLVAKLLGFIEASVDHLDSARRSRFAHRVMQDLFAARVGHGRAALLLRDITGRQKGGWLHKDLKRWMAKRGWTTSQTPKQ